MLLAFKTDGYEVVTSSWTASYKKGTVDVAYLWGADAISWFASATSTRRVQWAMSMDEFLSYKRGNVIDLRS